MELLTNGLLLAATLFAGGYCWVLARRVRELKSLDRGLGKSIVTLTRQIELARTTLEESRNAAKVSRSDLKDLIAKADEAAQRVADATRSAQNVERGLRYQISQAGERRRARVRDQDRAPRAEDARSEEEAVSGRREATQHHPEPPPPSPSAPERAPSRMDPAEARDLVQEAAQERLQQAARAARAAARAESAMVPRPSASPSESTVFQPEDGAGAEDGSGRTNGPSAEEVEPWKPRRAASVLRAGADLFTLKPLKPKAAKARDLPKPAPLPSLGNPLRGKSNMSAFEDEEELLAALSQLAAGGKR